MGNSKSKDDCTAHIANTYNHVVETAGTSFTNNYKGRYAAILVMYNQHPTVVLYKNTSDEMRMHRLRSGFDEFPSYEGLNNYKEALDEYTLVSKVDLVYDDAENMGEYGYKKGTKLIKCRFVPSSWQSVSTRYKVKPQCNFLIPSHITLNDIENYCKKYQARNRVYNKASNNCRQFMVSLFYFLGKTFPESFPCEVGCGQMAQIIAATCVTTTI
jgi:hypothetical protein